MRSLRVGILIPSAALGLLVTGCSATLTTKVEVYHPKSRLQALDETDPAQKRLISLINDRLAAEKELMARSGGVVHLAQMADDVIANLECFEPVLEEVVKGVQTWSEKQPPATKSGYSRVVGTLETESKATVREAAGEVQEARLMLIGGALKSKDFLSRVHEITSRFAENYKASLDLIREGDKDAVPSTLVKALERRDVALSGCSQELYDLTVGEVKKATTSSSAFQRRALKTDRSGIRRPDEIEETYTDPLLTAALNDKDGWLAIPAATKTSADGKSDVVIVRDGQFSFSVHTLENDPSTVIRHRLNLANSTINLLSTLAGTFAGVDVPGAAPDQDGEDSEDSDDQDGESAATEEISAGTLVRIARSRLGEVERLLGQTPADTAARRQWINEVNALFQPVTPETREDADDDTSSGGSGGGEELGDGQDGDVEDDDGQEQSSFPE